MTKIFEIQTNQRIARTRTPVTVAGCLPASCFYYRALIVRCGNLREFSKGETRFISEILIAGAVAYGRRSMQATSRKAKGVGPGRNRNKHRLR